MNDNVISLATSPALDSYTNLTCSTAGDLAKAYTATVESVKPKSYDFDATSGILSSMEKVNILPDYKVTCNLYSVNSAKILYYKSRQYWRFFIFNAKKNPQSEGTNVF